MKLLVWAGLVAALLGAGKATRAPPKGWTSAGKKCRAPDPLNQKHPVLQRNLDKRLNAAGLGRYVDQKRLAVSLVDLTRKGRTYYAGLNDDQMMYAASLPKIAILLSVVQAAEKGQIKWTHEFDVRLQNMVVASSNPDASWGTDLVGLLAIENTMRSPRYCFYDDQHGGLWVGRAFRKGGATNRDPMLNLSHAASARQAARFYTMLDAGRLVSKHWSFRMLGLMTPPKHFHKFVGGLKQTSGVAFLARKSGTWRHFHSDSALIQHQGTRYVAVGLSELGNGETVMRKLIVILDKLISEGAHRSTRRAGRAPPRVTSP